ncbi:MAG TPA: long-chain fatty acid--CoA ligase [Syntrophorhabdales bacterium]|nr:long-chain fatty acid--CoA ligase [Syntrophorhabdales bacterium]
MAETLCRMFQESVKKFADYPAMLRKVDGSFRPITYREMGDRVRGLTTALLSIGVTRGDRVALMSENRPEWAISDFAILHAGAVNVGIFPTLPVAHVEYIISDSGARCLIVSDQEQLAKALAVREKFGDLCIISMNAPRDGAESVLSYEALLRDGEASPLADHKYEECWSSVRPEDWASIIYTSGTTAEPRGAILSHQNFVSNYSTARKVLTFQQGDTLLSFVPLNHVFGRMVDHYLPISLGSTIAYVENLRRLRQNIQEVRPHYMAVVPRLLEMFEEGLKAAFTKEPRVRQKLIAWAFSSGRAMVEVQAGGSVGPLLTRKRWLADRLVFRRLRDRLGLDRLRFFFAGGAPVSRDTLEFFSAMGLPIMEGYGLSETSPLVSVNPPGRIRLGTVGRPFEGVEVKLADDGEILVRGPNVMQGYYKRAEETKEAIEPDGWLHTGDIGTIEDGYLSITDRKKNLIVLANGKKVLPQHLETLLLGSPFIFQAVLVGDRQNTVGALIVPAFDRVREWARAHGVEGHVGDETGFIEEPAVRRLIRMEIQRLTEGLADYEKIRAFALVDREFTLEAGELTPTLKIKRRVVLERYGHLIDSLYSDSSESN